MADISEVLSAIVAKSAQVLYPSGTASPSIAVAPIRIYQGWPVPAQLDADMAAGVCHVSAFPRAEERNNTRFFRQWVQIEPPAHTLSVTVSGQSVLIGGTAPPVGKFQNLAIKADGKVFMYRASNSDGPTSCATAIAALASAEIPGVVSVGGLVSFPDSVLVESARVGGQATMAREIRRTERIIQLCIWADTPVHRSAIAAPLDVYFSDLPFLAMPDGFLARWKYYKSPVDDSAQLERPYRRDLWYSVEYSTTQTESADEVINIETGLTQGDGYPVKIINPVIA